MVNRIVKRVAKGVGALALIALAALMVLLVALWVDHGRGTRLLAPSGTCRVGRATYVWRDETRSNPFAPVANTKQDLAVWIWYPAAPTPSTRKSEYLPRYWVGALERHEGLIMSKLLSRDLTRVETHSWTDAEVSSEQPMYPVVLLRAGGGALSSDFTTLAEDLASHGYVVVASTDMGATARVMTNDLEGIDAQARDISFLIGYARTLPDADMSEIAVAGFSWGGISNLFAAARDNRIDALVALDGSMRYYPGLVKESGYVHPEEMTLPLLFFTQGAISLEEQAKDFTSKDNEGPNALNAWTHGDLITVDDMALVHVEHSSMYQRNEEISECRSCVAGVRRATRG